MSRPFQQDLNQQVVPVFFLYDVRIKTIERILAKLTEDGVTSIVDANNNTQSKALNATELIDISVPKNISITLNSQMKEKQYVFARIGVKAIGVGERFYSLVIKIELR